MSHNKKQSTMVTWWKSKKCKRKMDCQRQKRLLASRRATDTSLRDGWQPAQFYELESCALLLACVVRSAWGFDYMQTKFTHSVFCASFSCIIDSVFLLCQRDTKDMGSRSKSGTNHSPTPFLTSSFSSESILAIFRLCFLCFLLIASKFSSYAL